MYNHEVVREGGFGPTPDTFSATRPKGAADQSFVGKGCFMAIPLILRDFAERPPAARPTADAAAVVWVPLPEGMVFDCQADGVAMNGASLWNRLSGAWLRLRSTDRAA